jgi:hypothetical protein
VLHSSRFSSNPIVLVESARGVGQRGAFEVRPWM